MTQSFAKTLKQERLNKGLSQEKLAEKSGLSARYISSLCCRACLWAAKASLWLGWGKIPWVTKKQNQGAAGCYESQP